MRIKKLELKNFRGFEDLVMDFPEGEGGLAVLVGVNGAGKTTILDAINNLFYHFTFDLYDRENGEFDKIKLRIFRTRSRTGDVRIGSSYSNVHSIIVNNDIPVNVKEDVYLDGSYGHSTSTLDNNAISIGYTPEVAIPESVFNYRNKLKATPYIFAYYPDNRVVPFEPLLPIEDISRLSFIDTLRNAFDIKIDFSNLFKWFRNFEDLENQKRLREDNSYRHKGLEVVRKVIPNFLEEFSNPFVNREGKEELVAKKDNLELSISQLSQGERLVIAMVSDIALRLHIANPKLENPLQGHGVVLIDEIEQHLHPGWQRSIIPNLRRTFPNIQFILTTHSPQVLSNVPNENVFVLEDFQLRQFPPYHTYGRDSNTILSDVFRVEERPEHGQQKLRELYEHIDKNDRKKAEEKLQQLKGQLGVGDPELVRAEMYIDLLDE